MNVRITWRLLLPVMALLALVGSVAQSGEHRIYSNVYYNEEGGDLLGTELELTVHGQDVSGSLRIYQGGCAAPSAVRGTLVHGKLHLTGESVPYAGGKFEVAGTIQAGFLILGKGAVSEEARLKRVGKAHCQVE
jgi:hypothetical protein